MIVFVTQKPKNNYEFFEITREYKAISQPDPAEFLGNGLSSTEPISFSELYKGLDVIAVLAQYSTEDYNKYKRYWGHGMIILFQYDRSIRYCYTNTKVQSASVSYECYSFFPNKLF